MFKGAGPVYSPKNVDFTMKLYYKVDTFAKTENSENPDFQVQKNIRNIYFDKKNIADLKRSHRKLCQTYLEITRLQV